MGQRGRPLRPALSLLLVRRGVPPAASLCQFVRCRRCRVQKDATVPCCKEHGITLQQLYIALHYIALHHIALHYTILHYTTLHYIMLHYSTVRYSTLHYTTALAYHVTFLMHTSAPHRHAHPIRTKMLAPLFSVCGLPKSRVATSGAPKIPPGRATQLARNKIGEEKWLMPACPSSQDCRNGDVPTLLFFFLPFRLGVRSSEFLAVTFAVWGTGTRAPRTGPGQRPTRPAKVCLQIRGPKMVGLFENSPQGPPEQNTHPNLFRMQQGGTEANSSRGLLNAPHSSSRTSWPWPTAVTTGRDESEILGVELRTTAASSGLGDGAGSPEAKPPFDVLCGQADIETFNSMIEATCAASGLGVICLQNEADPMTLHEPNRPINSQTELES